MKTHITRQNLAGVVVSSGFEYAPGLNADRDSIPSDGLTFVTFHYRRRVPGETQVVFTVNGVLQAPIMLDPNGEAELEVTATVKGLLEVSIPNEPPIIVQVV